MPPLRIPRRPPPRPSPAAPRSHGEDAQVRRGHRREAREGPLLRRRRLSRPRRPRPGAAAPTSDLDDPNGSRLFFLHGGEASVQIARDLAEKATARGLDPRVVAMDDFKRCDLDKRPAVAIFVVETVENAQPAEAAGACLRFYNRKRKAGDADFLRGKLRYAVLALGDTNLLLDRQTTTAKDCNQAGQTLDSALKFLGAERVVARCEANDAVGLEEAVEPWCESLWAPLADAVAAIDTSAKASASDAAARRARGFDSCSVRRRATRRRFARRWRRRRPRAWFRRVVLLDERDGGWRGAQTRERGGVRRLVHGRRRRAG